MDKSPHRRLLTSGLFWRLAVAFLLTMVASILLTRGIDWFWDRPQPYAPGFPLPMLVTPIIVSVLAIIGTSLILAWQFSRPLRHLHWALDRISHGDFGVRITPLMGQRSDEIGDLGRHFDRMAERLERLTEARMALMHDISHELRSPLARLRAAAGLAKQMPESVAQQIERIDREAERLNELIEALLTLNHLEAGDLAVRTRVDIIELLADIAENGKFEAEALGKHLDCQLAGRFVADVDAELIYRAMENVVRNAIKFTAPGTAVKISARVAPESAALLITVSDRGPGATREECEQIFEPFVRGTAGEPGTGSGLGLAIARRALQAHAGSISAEPRPGGGLTLRLHIPPQ